MSYVSDFTDLENNNGDDDSTDSPSPMDWSAFHCYR
jgi:hypothetical protein